MTAPRQFSDDEVRAIFQRAAARQEHARKAEDARTGRLTLDELQEIGRASGIDPAHITAAVAELDRPSRTPKAESMLGMPTVLYAERFLPHTVPDEAWERIVPELRRIFGTEGIGGEVGRVREWTMRQSRGRTDRAVKVSLIPDGEGTHVTLEQSLRGMTLGLSLVSGAYVLIAGLMAVLGLAATAADSAPFVTAAMFLALAVALFGGLQIGTRLYARRQAARFSQAIDRIELLARDAAPSAAGAMHEDTPRRATPSLDLDALPDAPAATEGTTTRTSTRA